MKKLILPVIIGFAGILASCSTYQISTISSTNSIKDEKTGVFSFENDSVKISYSFYGTDAPLKIQVVNKLDKPLYIDWQRSAVVIGNQAISYVPSNINISGSVNASTYTERSAYISQFGRYSNTSGSINAVAEVPKNVAFLPPHSQITNVPLTVMNGFFQLPDTVFHKEKVDFYYDPGVKRVNIKTASFQKEGSPLVFRSYLTLYTQDGNDIKPVGYQHEFYVSKIINTMADPAELFDYQAQRGDYFFNSKTTGYGKVMTGVGVVTLVGGVAAVDAAVNNKN